MRLERRRCCAQDRRWARSSAVGSAGASSALRSAAALVARLLGDVGKQIADVDHAARIVERFAHRPACANGRIPRRGIISSPMVMSDLDRLDIGARHHDVFDAHFAEAQDVVEHGPFVGRERLVIARRRRQARRRSPRAGRCRCGARTGRHAIPEGRMLRLGGRAAGRYSDWSLFRSVGGSAALPASAAGFLVCRSWFQINRLLSRIGIRMPSLAKMPSLERFHLFGFGISLVIIAEKMQKTMHEEMGEMVRRTACLEFGLARHRLRARGRCRPASAGSGPPRRTEKPGKTGRWSACPCRAIPR